MHLEEEFKPQTYTKRWLILFLISISIVLRGFNQSVFGPSNNQLADYFMVLPWQVDWFVLVQSVIFLSVALPLSMLTIRLGYRALVLSATISQAIGFAVTSVGFSYRKGFAFVLIGQGLMGFSNIVSWSLPPPTAAIWFGKNEVATAVAVQVVARGVGEAVGATLPTSLVPDNSTLNEIGTTWTTMYSILCVVGIVLTTISFVAITDKPEKPPSYAQHEAELEQNQIGEASKSIWEGLQKSAVQFWKVLVVLFRDPVFVAVWLLFGASAPVLRNNNVLLSSAVNRRFEDVENLNEKIGMVLMAAWIMYTIGGFVAGPLISYTQKFQLIVLIGEAFLFSSCVLVYLGVRFLNLPVIYAGVTLQGFMVGWCNTSLFEMIAEISYPHPTMSVTMINIICMGVFRLSYPLLGRLLINKVSVSAAQLFPCLITLICVVVSGLIRPTYRRKFANQREERRALLTEIQDEQVE